MTDTPELKPCPFCGSTDVELFVPQYCVTCNGCGVHTSVCETRGDAISEWNRRASQWRPIATAPYGNTVLLWQLRGSMRHPTGLYPDVSGHCSIGELREDGTYLAAGWTPFAPSDAFSHWMPLPEPPEVER